VENTPLLSECANIPPPRSSRAILPTSLFSGGRHAPALARSSSFYLVELHHTNPPHSTDVLREKEMAMTLHATDIDVRVDIRVAQGYSGGWGLTSGTLRWAKANWGAGRSGLPAASDTKEAARALA
jgi:hypothetical protein